ADEGSARGNRGFLHFPLDLKARRYPAPRLTARTHQAGFFACSAGAAAAAAAGVPNQPKQVAPDPDMRASRQCSLARSAASTSAMTGRSAIADASRSLLLSASAASSVAAVNALAVGLGEPRDGRGTSASNTCFV